MPDPVTTPAADLHEHWTLDGAKCAECDTPMDAKSDDAPTEPTTKDGGLVSVFKDAGGEWRWFAVHSNRYEDRQREIFPESAHKSWVDSVWATKQFPALRIWHLPVDIGRADFVDYDTEGFVVSSGHFNKGMDDVAERLAGMKGLGCSHGYLYRRSDLKNGVYAAYRTYEVTVLPGTKAANTLTAFFAGEEVPMLTAERKAFLVEVMGEQRAKDVEEGIRALGEQAREHHIAYKDFEERLLEVVGAEAGAKADAPEGMEKCPECDKMVAPDEMKAHAAEEHPGASGNPFGKKDEAAADEPAPDAAHEDEPPAATAPTPTAEEQAEAAATMAAAGVSAEPAEDGEKSAAAIDPLTAAFKAVLDPVLEQLRAITATQQAQEAELVGLRASRDSAIADIVRPKVGPDFRVVPPSMSPSNIVPPDEAAALKAAGNGPAEGPASPAAAYVDDLVTLHRGRLTG